MKAILCLVALLILGLGLAGCAAGDDGAAAPAAGATPPAAPAGGGALLADSGFRPEVNGFSFENYGDERPVTNLTAAEVYRLFGAAACSRVVDGVCTLTPPGQQWMEQINGEMAGGHCEGMAALSLLMFTDQVKETPFGGQNAADLSLANPALQREIAYWWTTQATAPTADRVLKAAPGQILETLRNAGADRTYTIGVYRPDGSDGHAITPFAIQDEGNGVFAILVYDNNYPRETRRVRVNTADDTWSYEAAVNPQTASELYQGDAETQTLDLTPTAARLEPQMCPFCAGAAGDGAGDGAIRRAAARTNEIFLDGAGDLLITDDAGRRLGRAAGRWVNEIPGAQAVWIKTATPLTDRPAPIYRLPAALAVTVTLDGATFTGDRLADLVLIGPGYSFGVEGITLAPGQVDTVRFQPDAGVLVYDTDQSESPTIIIGVEAAAADFAFEVQGVAMQGGGALTVWLDAAAGDLVINAGKLTNSGAFSLALTRYEDEREETFHTDALALRAGAIVAINYADWTAQSAGMVVEVDADGDGVVDEEYTASDKD
jgi:hypothetical protein